MKRHRRNRQQLLASPGQKACSKCEVEKSVEHFGRDRRHSDGLQSWCKACVAADRRVRTQADPEKAKVGLQRWYRKYRDRERAKSRVRSARRWNEQRERIKAVHRARYAKDPAKRRAIVAACIARDLDRAKVWQRRHWSRRRAQIAATVCADIDFEAIKRRDRMVCHICREKVTEDELHFDHVIPLSKVGEHTERNIAVAHALCNLRKNARILTLF